MRINHNISALNTQRQLGQANNAQQSSMEKLSSGLRINRAGDDAAGLSISEKMRGQIRGLEQSSKNAQDGISLIQTAEGALSETHSILQRMRELAVQAGNEGTLESDDMDAINDEITELQSELDGIADRTEFNGKKLLDGDFDAQLQIGANESQNHSITIATSGSEAFDAEGLGVDSEALDFSDSTKVDDNLKAIDSAIKEVSSARSNLGANQNRLDHTIKNLDNQAENLTAAESRIRDVDMAKEMMEQTKNSILSQASQAMLAQANQQPQGVLQLLR
ncbi:flagellin Hag [Thalassobacillus sp. B23F22_16]|uniref:flagellin Hag n=1 Tax=Thalassobacillus sp. B23F22_16 TaxID=3459513 RepID=UPI00373E3F47